MSDRNTRVQAVSAIAFLQRIEEMSRTPVSGEGKFTGSIAELEQIEGLMIQAREYARVNGGADVVLAVSRAKDICQRLRVPIPASARTFASDPARVESTLDDLISSTIVRLKSMIKRADRAVHAQSSDDFRPVGFFVRKYGSRSSRASINRALDALRSEHKGDFLERGHNAKEEWLYRVETAQRFIERHFVDRECTINDSHRWRGTLKSRCPEEGCSGNGETRSVRPDI